MIDVERSLVLLIDFQTRLMPAIHDAESVIAAAVRLRDAARLLDVPIRTTEQYPKGLGHTVDALAAEPDASAIEKTSFGAAELPALADMLDKGTSVVVGGCETHVCVLQTVLGLRARGIDVFVVADAVGSRFAEDRRIGLDRMARHGAETVTSEMVLFEWLRTADHPQRRDVLALIR